VACNAPPGIVSQNSLTDFTATSPVSQTLPLDSGSALVEVEVREKKTAQGNASMPTAVTLHFIGVFDRTPARKQRPGIHLP
jgi:hypothetical protein